MTPITMPPVTFSAQQKFYVEEFWRLRTKLDLHQIASTRLHDSDAHLYDLQFILPEIKPGCSVLDMGAGSGILSKAVSEIAGQVVAVDPFPEFYVDEYRAPNITVARGDLHTFTTDQRFDVVLLFGVMQNLDGASRPEVYRRMHDVLVDGGRFLLRHACGTAGDVFVDDYSENLGTHYVAFYPHLEQEVRTLENLFDAVQVIDVHPPHLNPWTNTHRYGFHCVRRDAA